MGEKSAVMLFNADSRLRMRAQETEWTLFGEKVEVKKEYKYLGVDVRTNMADWRTHEADPKEGQGAVQRPAMDVQRGCRTETKIGCDSVEGHGEANPGIRCWTVGWGDPEGTGQAG